MKRRILILIGVVLLIIIGYYLIVFNRFAKGVKEDSKRMKEFVKPDSIILNDSTVLPKVGVITDL
jgi:hypothetical protein